MSDKIGAQLSSHDHGNCELCDKIEHELSALQAENKRLRDDLARREAVAFRVSRLMNWVENKAVAEHNAAIAIAEERET